MAGNNPIGFSDFFNFGDRSEIMQALADMRELKNTYKEFKAEVTGKFQTSANGQLAALATEIKAVAAASQQLTITTQQGQQALTANLAVIEKLRAENVALRAAKKGAGDSETALAASVDGLNKKLLEQVAAYRKLDQSTDEGKASAAALAAGIRQTKTEITGLNAATKVTTTTFKAAAGSYNELDQQTKKLVNDLKQLQGGMGANSREAQAMQKQIHANTTKLKEFDTAMNHNFRNVGNYKSALGGVNNTLGALGLATVSLGGLVMGFNAVIDASQRWQTIEGSIRAVTNSSEEYTDVLSFLEVTANKYGKNLETLAGSYKSLSAATKNTSLEGKETKKIFDSIVAAGTALKLSNEQVNGSLVAIQQMISKGKVSAEELRGQLAERLPGANRLFAEAMGVSTQELEKMLKAGTVMATDVLPKVADKLNALYADKATQNAQTLAAETERLSNAWLKLGNSGVVTSFVASVKRGMTTMLESITMFTNDPSVKSFFGMFGLGSSNMREGIQEKDRQERLQKFKAASKAEREEMIKDAEANYRVQENLLSKVNISEYDRLTKATNKGLFVGGTKEDTELRRQREAAMGGLSDKEIKKLRENRNKAVAEYNTYMREFKGLNAADIEMTQRGEKEKAEAGADARAKAAKKAADEEKKRLAELEKRRREQDALIKAGAAYAIAAAEEEYAKSAQTAELEIALEQKKLQILKESFAARSALYKKDGKEWLEIQTEKKKAEADAIEKILKIRDKAIQQRVKVELGTLEGSMPAHETNYDAEILFQQKSLAIILKGIEDRKALYKADSEEYKLLAAAKVTAEADAAAKIRKIEEDRAKGVATVRTAQTGLDTERGNADVRRKVATGEMTQRDADVLAHGSRMGDIETELEIRRNALAKLKEGDVAYYDAKAALLDAEKARVKEMSDWEISEAQRVKDAKDAFVQMAVDFATNAAQSALEIGREINESRIEDLERQKDKELEDVGNNEAAKKAIEEKFAKQTTALRRKQAIADKAMAIFSIGINTAMAIIAALAPPPNGLGPIKGIPFSIAAGTIGALQIAAVLAKPLPKYATGRGRKSMDEVAEINEQGFELIERNGRMRIEAAGKRTATVLHRDDIVHPHARSKEIVRNIIEKQEFDSFMGSLLAGTRVVRAAEDRNLDRLASAIVSNSLSEEGLQRAFFSAMKHLPLSLNVWDEKGYHSHTERLKNATTHMKERNKIGGNG